jgi:hypothetical protein
LARRGSCIPAGLFLCHLINFGRSFCRIAQASNFLLTGCRYQSTFPGWSMSTAKARNLVMLPSTAPDKVRRVDRICTDWLAGCPSCGEALRFARTVLQIGDLSELQSFECKPCGLSITAQAVLDLSGA